MNLYSYSGPVMEYERCIAYNWKAQTRAVSEKKARSNFVFQFKKQSGRVPNSKISLPGKIIIES